MRKRTYRGIIMVMKKGFTLIELLAVLAIIGALASIVVMSGGGARMRSRDAKRVSDIIQLQIALEGFYNGGPQNNKEYPDNLDDLLGLTTDTTVYISSLPTDPTTNNDYVYIRALDSRGKYTAYCLGTTLENTNNQIIQQASTASACTSIEESTNYRVSR